MRNLFFTKKTIFILCLVFVFLSCTKDIEYQFTTQLIQTTDYEQCEYEQCPELYLETLQVLSPPILAEPVSNTLSQFYIERLTMEGQDKTTLDQAIQTYLNNSQTAYPENSVLSETHELEIITQSSFQSNDILSLQTEIYQYAGGAHGYSQIYFHCFDPYTGRPLFISDMITDLKAFSAFAKAYIEKQHSTVAERQSELPLFEDQPFVLPEVMGFTQYGLQLYYGPFEITEYQPQAAEVTIDWEALLPYLSF